MTDLILVAEPRDITGSKVKQLRREGQVPAVLYGVGDPQKVKLEGRVLNRVLNRAGSNDLIDLQVGNGHHRVLVRDIQRHVTRGDLLHVDFYEVDMTQTISAEAALVFVGTAPVTEESEVSAAISFLRHSVQIECLPDALVSEITVDISSMDSLSSTITVGDIIAPEGVTITDNVEEVVVNVYVERLEEEEVEEEAEDEFEFEEPEEEDAV
ncbi:MAG: 50S ribosomal protein L25 [Anaerolineae bacterium]|nr:50S ribosomal protein L25 [Anaerolineae bacterium]MCO5198890.1 50S ribosomal protein L25 [Anaerolineae bacterium]